MAFGFAVQIEESRCAPCPCRMREARRATNEEALERALPVAVQELMDAKGVHHALALASLCGAAADEARQHSRTHDDR